MPRILPLHLPARCRAAFVMVAALWLVAGCGLLPQARPLPASDEPARAADTAPAVSQDDTYALLQQAEKAASPRREQLLLQVARQYRDRGDDKRVGRVLREMDARALQGADRMDYSLLYGEWALGQRQYPLAASVLFDTQVSAEGREPGVVAQWRDLRARLHDAEQRPVDAVLERLAQFPLLRDEPAQREASEAMWRSLSQLREDEFLFLENAELDNTSQLQLLQGWLALARIQRQGMQDVERQSNGLRDWQRSWPYHPANRFMPVDMKLLNTMLDGQPRHIALLLPLTGKHAAAGRAVRDGFLSGYYRVLAGGAPAIRIDMIDTNAADILTAYQQAIGQGAELVVGPLVREQVQVLAAQPGLPVKVLALNTPPDTVTPPRELFQFSLNPEDDVRQVADAARANRLSRALVISPEGERGERLLQGFVRRWQQLGGELAGQLRYQPGSGNYSVQVAEALGVNLATGRFRDGARQPDVVFLVGNNTDAAALMQSLSRNGASGVPVYGTDQIVTTRQQGPGLRADGVRLCLSPLQAGTGPLREAGEPLPAGAEMLFAMGADARELSLRLALMQSNPGLQLSGNTGYLHMDGDRRIVRRLVWGVLQGGQVQVLPVIASDSYTGNDR